MDRWAVTAAGPSVLAAARAAARAAVLAAAIVRTIAALLLCGAIVAQEAAKEDEADKKPVKVDPYTGAEAAAMAAAGVVAYAPMPWGDHKRTDEVDKVLGEGRVRWLETAHFRIGSTLGTCSLPDDADCKRHVHEEIEALRKKLPKVPARPKKLDPWLRVHLYAQRCEKAYGEFLELVGKTDADFQRGPLPPDGAYLGLPDKYLVLLFQKRSDMARYVERFCDGKEDITKLHYFQKSHQMLVCVAAEGLEGFDESGVHGHVLHGTWHNMLNGYRAFRCPLPLWFGEGIAHFYARKIPTKALHVNIKDDEAVAEEKRADWPVKVRRRAQHEGAFFAFDTMADWAKWEDLGYHAHSQSWSRVDYLMHLDAKKVGEMLTRLKDVPAAQEYTAYAPVLRDRARQLLVELFGMDAASFDQRWRAFVLKTYPKK